MFEKKEHTPYWVCILFVIGVLIAGCIAFAVLAGIVWTFVTVFGEDTGINILSVITSILVVAGIFYGMANNN